MNNVIKSPRLVVNLEFTGCFSVKRSETATDDKTAPLKTMVVTAAEQNPCRRRAFRTITADDPRKRPARDYVPEISPHHAGSQPDRQLQRPARQQPPD